VESAELADLKESLALDPVLREPSIPEPKELEDEPREFPESEETDESQ